MKISWFVIWVGFAGLTSCKSSVKQQSDSIYSRHLQRHIDLTIINTPMPDNKSEMNLLLSINSGFPESFRLKKIIDSLYRKKLIQPLTLVSFKGETTDYGIEESGGEKGNQYRKFNEFVSGELYPYCKKKSVIRKFKSVAVCGFSAGAYSAFDVAFNNDEKIQTVGMFHPVFGESNIDTASAVLQTIESLRKRPQINILLYPSEKDSLALRFKNILDTKHKSLSSELIVLSKNNNNSTEEIPAESFVSFLLRAFGK